MADVITPLQTLGLAALASLAACTQVPAPASPIMVSSQTTVVAGETTDEPAPAPSAASRSVQVLVDKRVDRPTEVVGVLDFHSDAQDENKGFDELRARAAALGADAVIGAEFEHGDGNGPSHLSGMAVRFLDH